MGKIAVDQPRLMFKQLKGFHAINEQGKVKTILFLNAAREVVAIIGKISLLFIVIISSELKITIFVYKKQLFIWFE